MSESCLLISGQSINWGFTTQERKKEKNLGKPPLEALILSISCHSRFVDRSPQVLYKKNTSKIFFHVHYCCIFSWLFGLCVRRHWLRLCHPMCWSMISSQGGWALERKKERKAHCSKGISVTIILMGSVCTDTVDLWGLAYPNWGKPFCWALLVTWKLRKLVCSVELVSPRMQASPSTNVAHVFNPAGPSFNPLDIHVVVNGHTIMSGFGVKFCFVPTPGFGVMSCFWVTSGLAFTSSFGV